MDRSFVLWVTRISDWSISSVSFYCIPLASCVPHDDVIKWKHFPRYWPFVRGIHRSPVTSPHKGLWHRALMLSLICVWINGGVNNREAGDLRRHHAHFDVIVMILSFWLVIPMSNMTIPLPWASCQIRKIAGAHAPGMPGTFSPSSQVRDPDMHYGTCVTHVPWCMPGSLTSGFLWNWRRGETFPAFPAHAQPAIFRIW